MLSERKIIGRGTPNGVKWPYRDILLSIDGQEFKDRSSLSKFMAKKAEGDLVTVAYSRQGVQEEVELTLMKR